MRDFPLGNSRISVTIFAIALICAAMLYFLIVPEAATVGKIAADVGASRQGAADISAEVKSYEDSYAALDSVSGGKETFENMFPTRENMVNLIQGLEDAAARSGVTETLTLSDRLETPANKGADKPKPSLARGLVKIEEIPYTMEVSGTYRQILDFFLSLENQPFISEVGKFTAAADSISDKETETVRNTGTAAAKIEGSIFIRAE